MEAITFQCNFYTAKKNRDGGWMITLEVDSSQVESVAQLTTFDTHILNVAIVPERAIEVMG